jgi:2'-5' RNA ligase
MIKLTDLILEKKGDSYEYGCAMLYFEFPELKRMQKDIDKKDLYTEEGDRSYGLEDEPHVTLLFGFHSEVTTNDIKKVLNKFIYNPCKAHNVSLFKNEKYDVLKFDIVKNSDLKDTNALLSKLPHTTEFKDYHPHVTIAYIKPGEGSKYVDMFKGVEYQLFPEYALYSYNGGSKKDIINIKKSWNQKD